MKAGRVVVVTGAAGGMGALLVRRFLANGDAVLGTDTEESALARLHSAEGRGGKLLTLAADQSREEDCDRLAAFARSELGRVDVLVNCAGFFPVRAFEDLTAADWKKVIDINLTGVFFMTKALLPLMKGRGWGRIINVGSGSMFDGVAQQVHYVSAKAGVVGSPNPHNKKSDHEVRSFQARDERARLDRPPGRHDAAGEESAVRGVPAERNQPRKGGEGARHAGGDDLQPGGPHTSGRPSRTPAASSSSWPLSPPTSASSFRPSARWKTASRSRR
ncbi:MAG TPA: SDR family oxidoreductase [Myxococcales bacterium]|nr:SDR family oxidoreductase [Myxococcales bacterium]